MLFVLQDAMHHENGRELLGSRIVVEPARGGGRVSGDYNDDFVKNNCIFLPSVAQRNFLAVGRFCV